MSRDARVTTKKKGRKETLIPLPEPQRSGPVSLEETLARRRSVRELGSTKLSLGELGQLLWAAQGVTSPEGYRTAPSYGALYPLEIVISVGRVNSLKPGIYRYVPETHGLRRIASGERHPDLAGAAFEQDWVGDNAAVAAIAADFQRTLIKYGPAGIRQVHMEAGHAAQNLLLQAVALGLDTVEVGAFDSKRAAEALSLPEDTQLLLLIPIGKTQTPAQPGDSQR